MTLNFIKKLRWKQSDIKIGKGSKISSNTTIGYGTRINGKIMIKGKAKCTIGKYCALGADIKIITSNHDVSYPNQQCSLQKKINNTDIEIVKGDVNIGHNVWIGDSACILSGVNIGNGAVIGACALVNKNVPAYTVVAGNPAKLIRTRFPETIYQQLDAIAWWNWSAEKLNKNKHFFNLELLNLPEGVNLEHYINS